MLATEMSWPEAFAMVGGLAVAAWAFVSFVRAIIGTTGPDEED
jgi:hypothetical protein